MTTALSLMIKALQNVGADGLCNPGNECGCGIDDLAPCGCGSALDCMAAKWVKPNPDDPDYWEEYPDGYYKAVEA